MDAYRQNRKPNPTLPQNATVKYSFQTKSVSGMWFFPTNLRSKNNISNNNYHYSKSSYHIRYTSTVHIKIRRLWLPRVQGVQTASKSTLDYIDTTKVGGVEKSKVFGGWGRTWSFIAAWLAWPTPDNKCPWAAVSRSLDAWRNISYCCAGASSR